jgi:hypothetical protein
VLGATEEGGADLTGGGVAVLAGLTGAMGPAAGEGRSAGESGGAGTAGSAARTIDGQGAIIIAVANNMPREIRFPLHIQPFAR